jgi:pimeloyl-ACP methyl ester carboxylesterase
MNMRSSIAAALLLASAASISISACDPNATLEAKHATSHTAAAVEAKHTIPHAVYPIEARYAAAGPYATTETSYTLPTGEVYKIFRPASYGALGFASPIVTWGDGTGGTPDDTSVFLRHLASYGFTVIGVDLKNTGSGREIDAAAKFLVSRNFNPASQFYLHLNVTKVAAVGLSQGAGGAVRAATSDPGLYKAVETFSLPNKIWAGPNPDCPTRQDCLADPAALSQPTFFISTHGLLDAVIASPGTERAFFNSTHVHAALGIISRSDHLPADHPSIAQNPGGFLGYATAWLEYRLRGDAVAAGAFTGPHPELVSNSNWPGSAVK